MPYLIDGHNLIAYLDDISLDDPDDEAKLVQKLIGFAARTKSRCIVIFDAGLPGGWSRMSNHSVQVIFARHDSSADRILYNRIRTEKNPKMWTVVSSDNAVINEARKYRMQTIRAADFAHQLKHPTPIKPDIGEAPDVKLSEQEVEEWARLFEQKKTKTAKRSPKT